MITDDDWISTTGTISDDDEIHSYWLQTLLPNKSKDKINQWIKYLKDNEFETVSDMKHLDEKDWESLTLPLAVKAVLKRAIAHSMTITASSTSPTDCIPPVSQIDCVVIDISASMRARSSVDVDKSREDVSKMLFHTLIDKLVVLELYHAVGLLAFGESVVPIGITRDYERFHDELGRLDAKHGRTKLYDSIYAAADMIVQYEGAHCDSTDSADAPVKRVFVLTDGEDNASSQAPWHVAQYLQQKNIVLDAIPLAGHNRILQSICTASGGICFDIVSQEQGIELFEREATLHLAYREANVVPPPLIVDISSLRALETSAPPVTQIRSAPSATLLASTLTTEQALQVAHSTVADSTAPSPSENNNMKSVRRRVMKEYSEIISKPIEGWTVFVNASNYFGWKAVLSGLSHPYDGGVWLLTIDFPSNYPFKPPRVRFCTPVYHCNINNDGDICLDILKDSWTPAHSISTILLSVKNLMKECNPIDPLDAYKGQLCRDNWELYVEEAKRHTAAHASEPLEVLSTRYGLS